MKKFGAVAFAFLLILSMSLVGCVSGNSNVSSKGSSSAAPTSKKDITNEIIRTSDTVVYVTNKYLDGEMELSLAASLTKSYSEDLDDLYDAAINAGVYSSCSLYVGQIQATLNSWDKQKAAGINPNTYLLENLEKLQAEIDDLESK